MPFWKYLVFITITIVAYAGLVLWFSRRFVVFLPVGIRTRRAVLGFLVALYPVIYILRRMDRGFRYDTVEELLIGLYTVVVFLLFLGMGIGFRDILWGIARLVDRLSTRAGFSPYLNHERSAQWMRWTSVAMIPIAGLFLAVGIFQAHSPPRVREVNIRDCRLPPEFSGTRAVLVADLHAGPVLKKRHVDRLVRMINGIDAVWVFVVGDLVDGPVRRVSPEIQGLEHLNKPVFFVSGNHELYWDVESWQTQLTKMGFTVLADDHRVLEKNGAHLVVAGIPDRFRWSGGRVHASGGPAASLVGSPPGAFRILLSHRPTTAGSAEEAGFHLMLSGHTHGGQFFPFSMLGRWISGFRHGRFRQGNLQGVVTSGAGFWGPPVRLFHPPEMVLLTFETCK